MMRWTETAEHDAELYFQAHYILWVLGKLELDLEEELDALNEEGENWKQVMERKCPWPRRDLQHRFTRLGETLSDEEALDTLLQEIGFEKSCDEAA